MMRRPLYIAAVVAFVATSLHADGPPVRQLPKTVNACFSEQINCGRTVTGTIEPGDCTFSDGSRYDVWTFSGTAGAVVTITLRASSGFRGGWLVLEAPAGDASEPPIVSSGETQTIRYKLATTGTWLIGVSSVDVFGSGSYSLELRCGAGDPSQPQECVGQTIVCGNTFDWGLSASSCRSPNGIPFAYFNFQAHPHDIIRLSHSSRQFDPGVQVFHQNEVVQSAYGLRFSTPAEITYAVPRSGLYQFATLPRSGNSLGSFELKFTCGSTCVRPFIQEQPVGAKIERGGSHTLSVSAFGSPPLTYEWFTGWPPAAARSITGVSSSPTLTYPNAQQTQTVWVRVYNSCGSVDSDPVVIEVEAPPAPARRRAVRP